MVEPSSLIDVDSGLSDPLLTPLVHEESRKRHERRTELLRIWHHEVDLRQHQTAERFEATIPKSRVPLAIGDKVMFANDGIKRKMQDQASGPFVLSQKLGAHTWKRALHARSFFTIDACGKSKTHVTSQSSSHHS